MAETAIIEEGELRQPRRVDNRVKHEQALERRFALLKERGLLEEDAEGRLVCDIEQFKKDSTLKKALRMRIDTDNPTIYKGKAYHEQNDWVESLYYLFKDKKVYSQDDYHRLQEGESVEPRSLFYLPESADAASDIEKIKESKFYLGLWEVGGSNTLFDTYPTQEEGAKSTLSSDEAATACLIYHPSFGDGQRSEKDDLLYVNYNPSYKGRFYRNVRARQPINGTFFASWGYYGRDKLVKRPDGTEYAQRPTNTPIDFFLKRCPTLVEKGLVEPFKDFRKEGRREETGASIKIPSPKGLVSVGLLSEQRVVVNLGSEYSGEKGCRIYQLNTELVAILKLGEGGLLTLEKVFQTPDLSHLPEQEQAEYRKNNRIIKKGEITLLDISDLHELGLEDRLLVTNFSDFLSFSQETVQKAGFPLLSLTLAEKSQATGLFLSYKEAKKEEKEKLWDFLQKYKLQGLKTMLAFPDYAQEIIEIGQRMDSTKVFDDVQAVLGLVKENEGLDKQKEVGEVITTYTKQLLRAALPVLKGDDSVKGVLDIGDVVGELRAFRKRVYQMYGTEGTSSDVLYQRLLEVYSHTDIDSAHLRALALTVLHNTWTQEEKNGGKVKDVISATEEFYKKNEELFANANETTGDTTQQLAHFEEYVIHRAQNGRPIYGVVVDMGCGDLKRITNKMGEILPDTKIVGVDLLIPENKPAENVFVAQGNFTDIPVKSSSVQLVTAHWSVINDLTERKMHREAFDEVARVLVPGGEFYFDVPHLEGEGGWADAATQYHQAHREEPYGMIRVQFGKEEGERREKNFYIYPEAELEALLETAGFEVVTEKEWKTESGMPRKTYVMRLMRKVTPQKLAA